MNVVLVQHSEQQTKKYCFAVPDMLVPYVKNGANVICDTRIGKKPGRVVSPILSGDEADQEIARAMEECGARTPLRNISAVVEYIDITDVCVPIWMELTTPHESKLARRRRELREHGCFYTKVSVENGILKDGYTAYLVSKDNGMTMMPVSVFIA